MSTQTVPNILNMQGIVVGLQKSPLNMFKTFGNAITIKLEDFQQICSNTSAAIDQILRGEYTLQVINIHTDKTALFHLCSSEEMERIKTTQLISKQIKYVLKSVDDIEGKQYYLVITN